MQRWALFRVRAGEWALLGHDASERRGRGCGGGGRRVFLSASGSSHARVDDVAESGAEGVSIVVAVETT